MLDNSSAASLLTVCDAEYGALCERAYELYLEHNYNAELVHNARTRLEILENSREQEQELFLSDYRDAYSHLILGHYHTGNLPEVERAAMEAIYREVNVSIEASAVILSALNQVETLLAQHTQKYHDLVQRIDSFHTQSLAWDTGLEVPLFDQTMHRATRVIYQLHCQLTLENEWELAPNRSLNLINLSKALLVMQKLCATVYA